jgi:hypothetical protein
VGLALSCPRCGGTVRPPDLMSSEWRCDACGPVRPLHVAKHIGPEIIDTALTQVAPMPLWCPWPLPTGWMVTGVGWAGDERDGADATVLACSGPAPLAGGPADMVLIAEKPGVGLGNRFAGLPGIDPGPYLQEALEHTAAHAKVKAAGWPTPMWAVSSKEDRSAYVGEAKGVWLYAICWPASTGYLTAEDMVLDDLTDWVPPELPYGAPSPYLHGAA